MKKALIIIPAYNEEKNLPIVIEEINKKTSNFDYIIINDCSTDDTENLCKKRNYNVINLPINLGIGGGVQTGYLYARKYEYEYAVQFDGDGQHEADYLEKMLNEIKKEEYDMIIGSRFLEKEGFQSTKLRRTGINILSIIIRLFNKEEIRDVTSGLRIVNKKLIKEFCEYYPSDYPEPESINYCLRKKYKIKEIPVIMYERREGQSSINYIKAIYYMIKVCLALIIDNLKY